MFDKAAYKFKLLRKLFCSSNAIITLIDKDGSREIFAICTAPEVEVLAREYAKIAVVRNRK